MIQFVNNNVSGQIKSSKVAITVVLLSWNFNIMMPPFVVFPTNRIAHFVEVSLYLFYLAQRVKLFCGST